MPFFNRSTVMGALALGGLGAYAGFQSDPSQSYEDRTHQGLFAGIMGAAVGGATLAAGRKFFTGRNALRDASSIATGIDIAGPLAKTSASMGMTVAKAPFKGWKALGKMGKAGGVIKGGLIAGTALGVGGVVRAMRDPEVAETAYAVPTNAGAGYDYSSEAPTESGIRRRLASIGATGDLALALHKNR